MIKKTQQFEMLVSDFTEYLVKIQRRPATIEKYTEVWNRMKLFIDAHQIKFYDKTVGDQFLKYLYGNYDYCQLKRHPKNIVNVVESLSEFQQMGTIARGPRKKSVPIFTGPIGDTIESYISYKKHNYQLCDSTLKNYRYYLNGLYLFFVKNSIRAFKQVKPSLILLYINSAENKTLTRRSEFVSIKGYLNFLFIKRFTSEDYSEVIPACKYKSQPKLPSTFSKEEIQILLNSIDRGNPRGRRDYAILLLAIKLGLRASDITGLKFEYLDWEKNIISFLQRKTRKNIKIPLLPEVGNAIIDYLKNGRAESKENYCFLQIQSPYDPLNKASLTNIVTYHLNRAGINYKNRKHGPHALRHSLAGNLLQDKYSISVISEVLGHTDSETTMDYLRIDTSSLKQCAISVPPIHASFYNQK